MTDSNQAGNSFELFVREGKVEFSFVLGDQRTSLQSTRTVFDPKKEEPLRSSGLGNEPPGGVSNPEYETEVFNLNKDSWVQH